MWWNIAKQTVSFASRLCSSFFKEYNRICQSARAWKTGWKIKFWLRLYATCQISNQCFWNVSDFECRFLKHVRSWSRNIFWKRFLNKNDDPKKRFLHNVLLKNITFCVSRAHLKSTNLSQRLFFKNNFLKLYKASHFESTFFKRVFSRAF